LRILVFFANKRLSHKNVYVWRFVKYLSFF